MTSIASPKARGGDRVKELFARSPALGPTAALVIALMFFSIATSTFLNLDNFSTIIGQTVVVCTLALGQTIVILTAGIDLANGAIMVFATMLVANLATQSLASSVSVIIGIVVAGAIAAISGSLVTRLRLPPFIVTLGMLAVVTAVSALYSGGTTTDVSCRHHPDPVGQADHPGLGADQLRHDRGRSAVHRDLVDAGQDGLGTAHLRGWQ